MDLVDEDEQQTQVEDSVHEAQATRSSRKEKDDSVMSLEGGNTGGHHIYCDADDVEVLEANDVDEGSCWARRKNRKRRLRQKKLEEEKSRKQLEEDQQREKELACQADEMLARQLAAELSKQENGLQDEGVGAAQLESGNSSASHPNRIESRFSFKSDPRWASSKSWRSSLEKYAGTATARETIVLLARAKEMRLLPQTEAWSCGYGSLQMLLGAAASETPSLRLAQLFGGLGAEVVPDLRTIQRAVTDAWSQGFDPEGAEDFGGSLIGKKRWIGTTEIASALRASNIPTTIHTFQGPEAGLGVIQFALDTFGPEQVGRYPLYLQWQGHSSVIVGAEKSLVTGEPLALLVLDPKIHRMPKTEQQWLRAFYRVNTLLLNRRKYEIVQIYDPEMPNRPYASLAKILSASTAFK